MTRLSIALGIVAVLLTGCGEPVASGTRGNASEPVFTTESPRTTRTGGPDISGTGMENPPPFRLRYDDQELVLRPHAWCYANGCVDGFSEHPPSIGSPGAIRVHVPVEGWDLSATFTPTGQECGRQQTVTPVKEDGWYVLHPAGHAGRYDVNLFAQGGGDMAATFRWTTPADGELATPQARLALIADHDGRPDSYGVELALENLAETPKSAVAEVTVTAANDQSLTFAAKRSVQDCWPEGTVYFDGPDGKGKAAAALGDFPFHYEVTVTIDGTAYHAAADYPADEIQGNEPSVALEFSPALPALV